ncbi:MAG: hypothetical protein AUF67_00150 [Acidobacteria bacterium 13_1_20CM_58_21]|nr:MAG: hypothetical protein AUF67_00150 [Acidobacteria bacterium 13_1_20CM_58_21]
MSGESYTAGRAGGIEQVQTVGGNRKGRRFLGGPETFTKLSFFLALRSKREDRPDTLWPNLP